MQSFKDNPGRNRRHSLWYERILFSRSVNLLLGVVLCVILPFWFFRDSFATSPQSATFITLFLCAAALLATVSVVRQIASYPGARSYFYILPVALVSFGLAYLVAYVVNLPVLESVVIVSLVCSIIYCFAGSYVGIKYQSRKLAVVPFGRISEFCVSSDIDWRFLETPDLHSMRVDGVVADLRAEIPDEWQKFLAECAIHRIPVYNARQIHESVTGRVHLDHMYENKFGSLLPREDYELLKRVFDVIAVLLVLPAVIPVMLVTAWLIRRDDPGPVFFNQIRMGFKCKPFKVYKFRSMYVNPGTTFTAEGEDPRITRIGKVIRKYRIDELPQLFNVLQGNMSLIGPRPESLSLAEWYEKDVPFFHYRHVVRPGISGWAQVEQGYAAEVEGMTKKLEYDFYYIKHFSFWLDILIVARTIKTMLTGFGAR
ncbi:exopolysaccharide biosynthesis polyprenyl glycosylphosphotransferase [Larsenimonas rhizosphaerae]|uniref:Exopolysaccharide biosynthesis polyprenyl glycosylphosphotransferase n=1 Tax=Larsenimonas rhizosphaerae TaxID=2944682 RepID=A0AA41ZE52_9GAMM|nr:exopolysaccharide biosynthesis polyprenyl glycosylphosphotransferase [Larsenimonas rhizosphaerae]MCM2130462.1 exopolysaccharide biosynthesis polyprenyl glycosylphosphotransferase [Larsenimonas rhizosphaerae]MCX2523167.1 exopolysaccharide biosynthesis polyprenyl glycosylphosphotransferase [Larsenimonas rhizosphaerae]